MPRHVPTLDHQCPDAIIIPFHASQPDADGPYVNELMQYVHEAARGLRPARVRERRGTRMLVVLITPVRGWDLDYGSTVLFRAAILEEMANGQVEGWLVRDAADAQRTFREMAL